MGYKTILAVVDNVSNTQKLGEFVVSLADQFSSHVIGLHMETLAAVPLVAPMEIPDPATVQALQDVAHKETTDVGTIFEHTLSANGISHEWRSFVTSVGYASASAIDSARCADLIVARQSSSSALSDSRSDIEGFLYESGRPVLLVPHVLTVAKPIKRVLIAWNGSREATRATFDALPFLKAADSVEIFSVDQAESETQSSGLAGAELAATSPATASMSPSPRRKRSQGSRRRPPSRTACRTTASTFWSWALMAIPAGGSCCSAA